MSKKTGKPYDKILQKSQEKDHLEASIKLMQIKLKEDIKELD